MQWEKQAAEWEEGRSGNRMETTPYWRERSCTCFLHLLFLPELTLRVLLDVKEKDLILALNEEDRLSEREAIHEMNVVAFVALGMKVEQNQ